MFSVTLTLICETRQIYIKEYSINFGNTAPVLWYDCVKHYLLVTVRVALCSICHLEVPESNACSSSCQHTLLVLQGRLISEQQQHSESWMRHLLSLADLPWVQADVPSDHLRMTFDLNTLIVLACCTHGFRLMAFLVTSVSELERN